MIEFIEFHTLPCSHEVLSVDFKIDLRIRLRQLGFV